MRYISNPPDASSLMLSARSFGNYDLAGALADLIDNSINAKAKNVELICLFNNGNPVIHVVDDGQGMTRDELNAAMRPASKSPLEERSPDDLGRFGWGLKSASFSQCLCLTVLTRKTGVMSGAIWDLNRLENWKMATLTPQEVEQACSGALKSHDGTEVIWTQCDRLSEEGGINQDQFNEMVVYARNRLALIYHRYLGNEVPRKKLTITVNGTPVEEYDPFHRKHNATQPSDPEIIRIAKKQVKITSYILPHYSKLKQSEFENLAGDEGLIKNQGFYVYRNNRLIIYGTWFRLVKHGELSQIVRISIDIPNSLDSIWKITIDKSDAQLPSALRARLKQIVTSIKGKAVKVHRSKGGKIHDYGKIAVWSRYAKHGEISYEINRDHPLVRHLLAMVPDSAECVLKTIEQGFPVNAFSQDLSSEVLLAETDGSRFREYLEASLPFLLDQCDGDVNAMLRHIENTEPFCSNLLAVKDFLHVRGWTNDRS